MKVLLVKPGVGVSAVLAMLHEHFEQVDWKSHIDHALPLSEFDVVIIDDASCSDNEILMRLNDSCRHLSILMIERKNERVGADEQLQQQFGINLLYRSAFPTPVALPHFMFLMENAPA